MLVSKACRDGKPVGEGVIQHVVGDFADLVPEQAITEAFATATAIVALQPKSQTNTSSIAGQIPGMLASMGSSRVLRLRPVPPM